MPRRVPQVGESFRTRFGSDSQGTGLLSPRKARLLIPSGVYYSVTVSSLVGGKLSAMKPPALCQGYFERDVQEIIERMGATFCDYYCALCGRAVEPVNKEGGWVPQNHAPLEEPSDNPRRGM
jgi:hypothetical protein